MSRDNRLIAQPTMTPEQEAEWLRDQASLAPNDGDHISHGTANGYRYFGCRCRPCTDALAEAQREYRQRRYTRTEREEAVMRGRAAAARGDNERLSRPQEKPGHELPSRR